MVSAAEEENPVTPGAVAGLSFGNPATLKETP
jgi:hypothetical protein